LRVLLDVIYPSYSIRFFVGSFFKKESTRVVKGLIIVRFRFVRAIGLPYRPESKRRRRHIRLMIRQNRVDIVMLLRGRLRVKEQAFTHYFGVILGSRASSAHGTCFPRLRAKQSRRGTRRCGQL
jgi:hypothetical protein